MRKILLYSILAVTLLASCTGINDKRILGTWKVVAYGFDGNYNKVFDSSERSVVAANEPTFIYVFKANGKLDLKDGDLTAPMTWNFKDDSMLVMTLDKDRVAKVLSLSNTDLIWETIEGGRITMWQVLEKQWLLQ